MTGDGSKFTQRKKCREKFCLSLGSAGQLSPVKRAAPYGAASPGLTGSHMFVMFLTLSNKTAHFKPSGRDGKKGSSPAMMRVFLNIHIGITRAVGQDLCV